MPAGHLQWADSRRRSESVRAATTSRLPTVALLDPWVADRAWFQLAVTFLAFTLCMWQFCRGLALHVGAGSVLPAVPGITGQPKDPHVRSIRTRANICHGPYANRESNSSPVRKEALLHTPFIRYRVHLSTGIRHTCAAHHTIAH